eukprot:Clim_evm50s246 gene=Clim_evmTU50s246
MEPELAWTSLRPDEISVVNNKLADMRQKLANLLETITALRHRTAFTRQGLDDPSIRGQSLLWDETSEFFENLTPQLDRILADMMKDSNVTNFSVFTDLSVLPYNMKELQPSMLYNIIMRTRNLPEVEEWEQELEAKMSKESIDEVLVRIDKHNSIVTSLLEYMSREQEPIKELIGKKGSEQGGTATKGSGGAETIPDSVLRSLAMAAAHHRPQETSADGAKQSKEEVHAALKRKAQEEKAAAAAIPAMAKNQFGRPKRLKMLVDEASREVTEESKKGNDFSAAAGAEPKRTTTTTHVEPIDPELLPKLPSKEPDGGYGGDAVKHPSAAMKYLYRGGHLMFTLENLSKMHERLTNPAADSATGAEAKDKGANSGGSGAEEGSGGETEDARDDSNGLMVPDAGGDGDSENAKSPVVID